MPCSPCHPSHCPSCYTTHFWVKQRQERAPGNEHRLMISRENRPEPRREQTSRTTKRITRESIFCFKVMFQNFDYLEQRCWAGGKKMDRKREMNQSLKAEGKHEKCWNEAWGRSSGLWFLHLLNQNDGLASALRAGSSWWRRWRVQEAQGAADLWISLALWRATMGKIYFPSDCRPGRVIQPEQPTWK